jgi:hypothetical protein
MLVIDLLRGWAGTHTTLHARGDRTGSSGAR